MHYQVVERTAGLLLIGMMQHNLMLRENQNVTLGKEDLKETLTEPIEILQK